MKKILVTLFLFWGVCQGQIYTPVNPTTYGENVNRIKPFLVNHLPMKNGLLLNTTDSTAQIFYNIQDSSVYYFSAATSYVKLTVVGGAGANNYLVSANFTGGVLSLLRNGLSTLSVTGWDIRYLRFTDTTLLIPTKVFVSNNYYNKNQLQTSGLSSVHWDNITNKPNVQVGINNIATQTQTATGSYTHDWNNYSITFNKINNLEFSTIKATINGDTIIFNSGLGKYYITNVLLSDTITIKPIGLASDGSIKRLSFWPTGGGGGGGLTYPNTVHKYLNGYGAFPTLNTDSITEGSTNLFNRNHTGDVTGATVTTISTNVVTNTKLAQMPTLTIKGNNTGSTADAKDLTVAEVKTMLDLPVQTNNGDTIISGKIGIGGSLVRFSTVDFKNNYLGFSGTTGSMFDVLVERYFLRAFSTLGGSTTNLVFGVPSPLVGPGADTTLIMYANGFGKQSSAIFSPARIYLSTEKLFLGSIPTGSTSDSVLTIINGVVRKVAISDLPTASGGGITSLNGLTGASQTFATPGTTGTAPNWVSSGSTHTLHIPMASASSVTAGLLSKTDYDIFSAKQTALSGTGLLSFIGTTPSYNTTSSSIAGIISDETGTGTIMFNTTPSFTTGFTIGGAATSRKIIVGNGTNFVASTETWAVPGTSGNVLTSDGTNWISSTPGALANSLTIDATLISGGPLTYNGSVARSIGIQPTSVTNAMLAGSIAVSKTLLFTGGNGVKLIGNEMMLGDTFSTTRNRVYWDSTWGIARFGYIPDTLTSPLGHYSFAAGDHPEASGNASIALGNNVKSKGDGSFSTGFVLMSKSFAGTVIGHYNDSSNATSGTTINSANRVFQIGIGTAGNNRKNAMTVLDGGNVGIGSTVLTPTHKLEIGGSTKSTFYTSAFQTLTDASTITLDVTLGTSAKVTLGATGRTLTISNLISGEACYVALDVYQDGTGSRTITTWPSGVKWKGGVAPTLTTTAGAHDIITFKYDGTELTANYGLDYK